MRQVCHSDGCVVSQGKVLVAALSFRSSCLHFPFATRGCASSSPAALSNFAACNGKLFHKTCLQQEFRLRGSYDDVGKSKEEREAAAAQRAASAPGGESAAAPAAAEAAAPATPSKVVDAGAADSKGVSSAAEAESVVASGTGSVKDRVAASNLHSAEKAAAGAAGGNGSGSRRSSLTPAPAADSSESSSSGGVVKPSEFLKKAAAAAAAPSPAPAPAKRASVFVGGGIGGGPKCAACQKSVYGADPQVSVDKSLYHTPCFKCSKCNSQLTLSTFAACNGLIFHKSCLKQEFTLRGSYDDVGKSKEEREAMAAQKAAAAAAAAQKEKASAPVAAEEKKAEKKEEKKEEAVATPSEPSSVPAAAVEAAEEEEKKEEEKKAAAEETEEEAAAETEAVAAGSD